MVTEPTPIGGRTGSSVGNPADKPLPLGFLTGLWSGLLIGLFVSIFLVGWPAFMAGKSVGAFLSQVNIHE